MTPSTASASAPAAAGSARAAASSSQVANGHQRRDVDARIVEPRHEGFEPRAPLGERPVAQVLAAVDEQIVGAQMRGKFGEQLGVDGLAVEPLLQHVEALHAALAQDQQLAVDRAGKPQRLESDRESSPKCPRRCANRAAPRLSVARAAPATACTRMPSHFHSAMKSPGSSAAKIAVLDRVRQHRRAERRRIALHRLLGAAFEPGEQLVIGRRRPGQISSISCGSLSPSAAAAVLASRAETPMRSAPVTSLSSAQRPVSSSASSQRASCAGQFRLAERGERVDDVGERDGRGCCGSLRSDRPATSARPSPTGRRHNRRTARTAPGRCARRSARG